MHHKKIIKIITNILCLSLLLISCEENEIADKNVKIANAITFYAGDPAVDGCGWLLITDSLSLSPVNLHSNFQKDSLKVRIKYKKRPESFYCGMVRHEDRIIELIEIVLIDL